MGNPNISISALDEQVIRQLDDFVPQRIFDAHAHLYDSRFMPTMFKPGHILYECGPVMTTEDYHKMQGPLYGPGRQIRLNIVTFPEAEMADAKNGLRADSTGFLKEELIRHPENVGEVFVIPDDTPADIEAQIVHPNIRGLKCYHTTAQNKPTWQADIEEYLPESAWQVAHERGMCITLHMVKDQALSDPNNLATIKRLSRRYPGAKLILAHCARSFAAWTAIGQIEHLKDCANIYYDMSGVCESPSMIEIIKVAGPDKMLWGSDFPISMTRGKCISIADKFLWLDQAQIDSCPAIPDLDLNLIGVEGLLAFRQAAHLLDLTKTEVEDIFYNNAMNLFELAD